MTAKSQYLTSSRAFRQTRLKRNLSLRLAAHEIGLHYSALFRFEKGVVVNAVDYLIMSRFVEKEKV